MSQNINNNYAIIISTCEKFSDLWEENIRHFKQHWKGNLPRIILVSDAATGRKIPDVEIVWFAANMPFRIKQALSIVDCAYVLVTLDDYFLIQDTQEKDISRLVEACERDSIHYLQLYHRRKSKVNDKKPLLSFETIDLDVNYAVSLYPAIWNKKFLDFCIKEDMSPWEFEPKLTRFAREYHANCAFSKKCCFYILDVVRKGRVLHKAQRYFKKTKVNIGNRPIIGYGTEIRLKLADAVSAYLPKQVYNFGKVIARKMGYKFFSDKI